MGSSLMRRESQRFGVEALCLLMVLYGAPLQALQSAGPPENPESVSEQAEPSFWGRVSDGVDSVVAKGLSTGETLVGQPWTDAVAILLATGTGEEVPPFLTDAVAGPDEPRFDSVPPLPPGFRESATAARRAGIPGTATEPDKALVAKDHLEAIPVLGGWNLLSIPEEPTDPAPASVLAPIVGSLDQVFAYDACDPGDPWKLYDPNDAAASDLLDIDPTKGLWLRANGAVDLPSEGTLSPTTSWQLCTGWNLIGFPAGESRHVLSALQSIAGKFVRVFGFDPADPEDAWEVWDVTAPTWANDLNFLRPGFGYWVLLTEDAVLEIANQGDPPTVEITSPADLGEIAAPTEIRGTIQSPILDRWTLTYRLVGEPDWIELATGAFPVTDAPLATLDTTQLINGLYEIRLEAVDIAGMAVEETLAVSVEGNMKIGHFTVTYTDLAVPLSGLDIEVLRTYDSRQRQRLGDFGQGWTLEIRQGSYRNNRLPGEGWQVVGGTLPCQSVQETKSHLTTVRLSDREIYRFRLQLVDPAVVVGGCFATASFAYVDGPTTGATLEILGNDDVIYQNASDQVIDADSLEIYEPQNVRLTTLDGRIFDFDLALGVQRVEDSNGNSLDITPAGIQHSSGESIDFERDAAGRIVRVVDPLDRANVYEYDAEGNLVSATDREGARSSYSYLAGHLLAEIENAEGVVAVRTEYDSGGRMNRMVDAQGQAYDFGHDLDARREVVTDRLGATQIFEYDGRGNVVRQTDALGQVTTRTFDAEDRLLSERDPLGNTVAYTYDANGQVLTTRDPAGGVFTFTRDASGRPLTLTDPLGAVTRLTYDAAGNILTKTNPTGGVTQTTYNGAGDPLTVTDALGNVTTMQYDGGGRVEQVTDGLGNTTQFAYNAMGEVSDLVGTRTLGDGSTAPWSMGYGVDNLGRRTRTTLPNGVSTTTVFDSLGRIEEVRDTSGRVTTLEYDSRSRLVAMRFPDGTSELSSHDAEGRIVSRTDRGGRVTTFEYDGLGRRVRTTLPDGGTLERAYDAAGRLLESTDPLGATTRYAYDAAGRVTQITDALGNSRTLVYDLAGNLIEETDALGRRSQYEVDAGGRRTKAIAPEGTEIRWIYDALGRPIREIDANGLETQYSYDAGGRLIAVTDALGGVTQYAYDELGNRVAQTDALGRTTRFEFDDLGNILRRILPDGSAETFTYDGENRRTSHVSFDGDITRHTYDAAGRLLETTLPDGSTESYTYTTSGRIATVTDARGVTRYTYDSRDRRLSIEDPEGWVLENRWDAAGNRLSTSARLGSQTLVNRYGYDAVGRLLTVEDSLGRSYGYTYDVVGRITSLTHPNATVTTYGYDALDRLTRLETVAGGGQVVESFDYSVDAVGNRVSVVEEDQTRRIFDYDDLYRLVRERVEEGDGSLVYQNAFTYDGVGNRLQLERTGSDASVQTHSYLYDSRDRLLEDRRSDQVVTYAWDLAGRLVGESVQDGAGVEQSSVQYSWGSFDRLTRAVFDDGREISYAYDHRRALWKRGALAPDGAVDEERFVVDDLGPFSQVFGDLDASDNFTAQYPRGADGRVLGGAMFEAPQQIEYHADGLGSVRAITAADGSVVSRFDYEAFGTATTPTEGAGGDFRFAGERLDPDTGLYGLRARWMDPGAGRFLSLDPVLGDPRTPITLHRYLYAGAQPVNNVDPSGEFFVDIGVGLSAVVGFSFFHVIQHFHQLALLPPLPAAQARALEAAKSEILALEPDPEEGCHRKVISKLSAEGFDLDGFKTYLRAGTHFLDGTQSLARPEGAIYPNAISAKAFLLSWGLPETALVRDVFAQNETRRVNAITSITKDQLTVFFRPDAIEIDNLKRNSGLVFHEGLHGYSYSLGDNWGDVRLKQILELSESQASAIITRRIANKCFDD